MIFNLLIHKDTVIYFEHAAKELGLDVTFERGPGSDERVIYSIELQDPGRLFELGIRYANAFNKLLNS